MADQELYEGDHDFEENAFDGEEFPIGEEAEGGEAAGEDTSAEVEALKRKLEEMEEEAAKLKQMQDAVQTETGMTSSAGADAATKEETDARSVYVGNVDYGCTPEELQLHFQECGTVNRVTILADRMGNPKGFAYIEFLEVDAVNNALLLDNSELRGRNIKVAAKRTNVPGMKRGRGRGRGGGGYYGGWYPPRGRGRGRFRPY